MKIPFDLSVYLVTDRKLALNRKIEWIVQEAAKGGATMVQLREKDCSSREFLNIALSLKQILQPYRIPLIINDRLDIALACDAEGLHIGQSDLPYSIARKLLGNDKIIGLSVDNIRQVEEANDVDVDYIGISPVFSTLTKTDTSHPFGLEGIRQAAQISKHRMVGIGGINMHNANDVIKAGAEGVAVVSAIVSAPDPQKATKNILNQITIK